MVDDATYRTWWALHLRAARGEALSQDERARYEEGLRALHREESLDADLPALRRARDAAAAAEAACAQLRARREALADDIAALEAALSDRARQALGVAD